VFDGFRESLVELEANAAGQHVKHVRGNPGVDDELALSSAKRATAPTVRQRRRDLWWRRPEPVAPAQLSATRARRRRRA